MRIASIAWALPVIAAVFAGASAAQDGAACKEILNSKSALIVTVKFVLKAEVMNESHEQKMETPGVVVDETGLIMLNGAALGGSKTIEAGPQTIEMKTTVDDIKVVFGSETEEYEAVLAAKDSKLNLGFVQIKDLKGKKIQALKFAEGPDPEVGQALTGISRLGRRFDYAPYFQTAMPCGEVKTPIQMWPLCGGFAEAGLPLFDRSGRTVGVAAMPSISDDGSEDTVNANMLMSLLGMGSGAKTLCFLLPARTVSETVEKARKQAVEALTKIKEGGKEGEKEGEKGAEKEGEKQAFAMTKENAGKLYVEAVEAWAREFKAAKPEDRGKVDFMGFLNNACSKAGFKDWPDFCSKAAKALGPQGWSDCVKEFTARQTEIMKNLADEIQKAAEGK